MSEVSKQETVQRGNSALAVKAGFWYVLSSFLVKAISFLTTPIFSRLMSKADYGEFSNFASWQTTLLVFTSLELYQTLSRAYYDFTDDYDAYVSTVTTLGCAVTAIFYVIFLCFKDTLLQLVAIPEQYVHLMFITLFFQAIMQVFLARERTLYRYRSVAVVTALNLVIPTALAVILVWIVPESGRLASRLYGYYIPSSVISACVAVPLLWKGRHFRWKYVRFALILSLPLCLQYLMANLLTSTNTMMAKAFFGAEQSAVVSITTSVCHIMTIFFQAVSGALTTWLMDNLEQKNDAKVRKDMFLYLMLLVLAGTAVILLAPEVVALMGGARYSDAIPLIPGLILGATLSSMTTIFTIILTYDKNVVRTAVWTGITSALSLGIRLWLMPKYGISVIPYASIGANALLFAGNYVLVRRAGYGRFVDFPKMLAVVLAMSAVTALCRFVLYRHTVLRLGIIGLFAAAALAVLIWKRKEIFAFLRKTIRSRSAKT